ncbi:MAG: hypothetical protein ACRD3C_13340, partial [Vicinamibacterales bacterium]
MARSAFIVFDVLRHGDDDLRPLPLRVRRSRLEALLGNVKDARLRISEQAVGDGRTLHARARAGGWEGLIAKRRESPYASGRRSPDWRKLKLVRRQACVIGGWTDPRGSRPFFGALLLGLYDDRGRLHCVGHTGAGFTGAELERVWQQLRPLATHASPFDTIPRTNAPPHWVRPQLVAEVKFTEWTADGKLRHPTYVGMRDDIAPGKVQKEPDVVMRGRGRAADGRPTSALTSAQVSRLLEQVDAMQEGSGNGVLELPDGNRLDVTTLRKIFWPRLTLTKGDLFRHYIRVAPYILPVLADRPLVMKRYPNGIEGKPFYQHRAPDSRPPGVRVEHVAGDGDTRPYIIGGSLITLLYT